MGSQGRAPAITHPLEGASLQEIEPAPHKDARSCIKSNSVANEKAYRVLDSILDQDSWNILRERTPRDALVDVLAHTVHELIRMVSEESKAMDSTEDILQGTLRDAMLDEWDLSNISAAQPHVEHPDQLDAAAWLQSLALSRKPSMTPNRSPSPEADAQSESSKESCESPRPTAPVVELAHMVPVQARPPPFLPPKQEQGIQVDRYGFVYTVDSPPFIPTESYEAYQAERKGHWDAYLTAQNMGPERAWQKLFQHLRQLDLSSSMGQNAWRTFQRLCHQGIPMCYRAAVWSECVRASDLAEPGRYQDLVAGSTTSDPQIALDVRRTMPSNLFFGGKGAGVEKLQRILAAACAYNPTQGYCQGMNNIAAILLLTYTHEEDAFWTLIGIMQNILPADFYDSSMRVPQADQRVLMTLIRSGMPRLYAHFHALNVELAAVTYSWFLSLFTVCLPSETLFRVWDIMLVDGSITLFRVAYAILAHAAQSLLAAPTAGTVYDVLRDTAAQWVDAESLIQACSQLRGAIRPSDIAARRDRALARTCLAHSEI